MADEAGILPAAKRFRQKLLQRFPQELGIAVDTKASAVHILLQSYCYLDVFTVRLIENRTRAGNAEMVIFERPSDEYIAVPYIPM